MAMVSNSAHYHQPCRLKYNNTKYVRAEKISRVIKADSDDVPVFPACKRSRRSQSTEDGVKKMCAFSAESTFQIDKRVRACDVHLKILSYWPN